MIKDINVILKHIYSRLDELLVKTREIEKNIRFIEAHYKKKRKKRRIFKKSFINNYDFSKNNYWDIDWENWRKDYLTLSINDQRKVYNESHRVEEKGFFHTHSVIKFLNLTETRRKIIEIGGADGSLAKQILGGIKTIDYWDNYEISDVALSKTTCNDRRYKGILINKFPWEMTYEKQYNTLIMSDVAEHFKEEQLSSIIDAIEGLTHVYYKIPWEPSWKTYNGTHVLEMDNWKEMDEFMLKKGFKDSRIDYFHTQVRCYFKNHDR